MLKVHHFDDVALVSLAYTLGLRVVVDEKLAEMGRCAKTMAIVDSSEKIYQYILEAARK